MEPLEEVGEVAQRVSVALARLMRQVPASPLAALLPGQQVFS